MGTRHLVRIIDRKGELRLSQYGQFDGYPEVAGVNVLRFLQEYAGQKREQFTQAVGRLQNMTQEMRDAHDKALDAFGTSPMPWLSRNTGADILSIIMVFGRISASAIFVIVDEEFGNDTVMCEWVWTIDLKSQTFICQENLKSAPLASWPLDNLPDVDTFLAFVNLAAQAALETK